MLKRLLLSSSLVLALTGCGFPMFAPTEAQREADLHWVFAKFDQNYAPMDWKKANLGVDFEQVKQECFAANRAIQGTDVEVNDAFRALVFKCVSKFRDAHTSAFQMGGMLRGQARVATIGIVGQRHIRVVTEQVDDGAGGKKTVTRDEPKVSVASFLPTTKPEGFPLAAGDVIVKIDGREPNEVIQTEIAPYIDAGLDETNLTVGATSLFLRSSLAHAMPTSPVVKLTVERGGQLFEVELPWRVVDYYDFSQELEAAKKAAQTSLAEKGQLRGNESLEAQLWKNANYRMFFNVEEALKTMTEIAGKKTFTVRDMLVNTFGLRKIDPLAEKVEATIRDLQMADAANPTTERGLPANALLVTNASFPAYLVTTDKGLVGYVRVATFSVGDAEVANFAKLINTFNQYGVKGLILDTLDNGGGSLVHGIRMVDMLSSKQLEMPRLQVRLNDSWINSFEGEAMSSTTDAGKAWGRKWADLMRAERTTGQRLSSIIPMNSIDLFRPAKPNCASGTATVPCVKEGVKIVLLVNEMCASMCDIFAQAFQENALGNIIGKQTMGAGGNVVQYGVSPASNFIMSQTESLVVKKDGTYLENKGIVPDMIFDVVKDRPGKYAATLAKALEVAKQ